MGVLLCHLEIRFSAGKSYFKAKNNNEETFERLYVISYRAISFKTKYIKRGILKQ